jgi:integrase
MPNRSLTQLFVDRIGPKPTDQEYWDTHLASFGLRVRKTGAKSWVVMYRVRGGGRQVRETLGKLTEIPTVAEARKRALASLEKARAGVDPVAERRGGAALIGVERQKTFAAVADRFVAEFLSQKRPNTIANWTRIIEKDIKPAWGDRPIHEITQDDALALLNAKARTRPKQADEVRKVLRRLCAWAISERLIAADADPTEDVAKRVPKRAHRDRALTDSELKAFWEACGRLGWPFGPAFKLLALTAQRRDEVGSAEWCEFDGETWTVPAARSKNGKANIVHLSRQALAVLEEIPKTTGELLFASRGAAPNGYSKAKARLDGYMAEIAGGSIEPWVLHDLRRTFTEGMARVGIEPHVADRVLNHQAGTISGVAKIYNKFAYLEKRELALDAWGMFVELVCERNLPSKVAEARVEDRLEEDAKRRRELKRGDAVPLRAPA